MATDMGREYPPVIIPFPYHMSFYDRPLYLQWAVKGLSGALRQFFDVGLGEVKNMPPETTPEMSRMWIRLNQKRADAIVEYENSVALIEFRHHANPDALGRLITYKVLWKEDPVIQKYLQLILVTDWELELIRPVAQSLDIQIVVLEEA